MFKRQFIQIVTLSQIIKATICFCSVIKKRMFPLSLCMFLLVTEDREVCTMWQTFAKQCLKVFHFCICRMKKSNTKFSFSLFSSECCNFGSTKTFIFFYLIHCFRFFLPFFLSFVNDFRAVNTLNTGPYEIYIFCGDVVIVVVEFIHIKFLLYFDNANG